VSQTIDLAMEIQIRRFSGQRKVLEVPETATVDDLRHVVSLCFNISPSECDFLYLGQPLDPAVALGSLRLSKDSFLVCYNRSYVRTPQAAAPIYRGIRPIPRSFDKSGRPIPFNIDALVRHIVCLQFTPEHARAALEFTGYDLKNAIALLVDGSVAETRDDDRATVGSRRRGDPLTESSETDPDDIHGRVQVRPSEEERKLLMKRRSLTLEQRQVVDRLAVGRDESTVLQVYLACEKDENLTMTCLATMAA
jgi:hypothetical protein